MEHQLNPTEQNSFLHARDPSILAWNRPALNPNIKTNLFNEFASQTMDSQNTNDSSDLEQLQVYLRIKPSTSNTQYKILSDKILVCETPKSQSNKDTTKLYKYSFSRIYGPSTSQKELFDHCVKDKILNFINGQDSTLFTYGTSGAGKTFTIMGDENNPGIIPRALEYIFRTLPSMTGVSVIKPLNSGSVSVLTDETMKEEIVFKNRILSSSVNSERNILERTYRTMQDRLSSDLVAEISGDYMNMKLGVWVSFSEIYNEHIHDLLQSEPINNGIFGRKPSSVRPKLPVGLDNKGKTYVKNLSSVCVTSGLEAYKVMEYGLHNLNYASTDINKHSSRSHCIFSIKLVQYNQSIDEVQISHFNFCDLAGSERVKNSHSVGLRLKESSNINNSLHVLGRCIKAIRASQKNKDNRLIPFRESKLTRLFQPALSGQETVAMIVNINPDKDMFDENQHVLNFSAIAKDVTMENIMKPVKIELKHRISECIENKPLIFDRSTLEEQIEMLQSRLEEEILLSRERENQLRKDHQNRMHQQLIESSKNFQLRFEEMKNRYKERYQKQHSQMENHYKQLVEVASSKPMDIGIVDLTDDDIDHKIQLDSEIQHLKEEMEYWKNKYLEEKSIRKEKEQLLEKVDVIYGKLEDEHFELQKRLESTEFQLENVTQDLIELEERYSTRAVEQQEQVDYVEELEEQLNATLSEMID